MTLNLKTNCVEHNVLKEYLEANASAALAEKINHGVFIEKDGKRLLNRKDLNGFMQYACGEAKKLAEKGATSACLKSDTVFSWAIHYFEEDSIEGKLYNEDGSEYKPVFTPIQRVHTPSFPIKSTPPKPQVMQFSLFDPIPEEEAKPVIETPHKEEPCTLNIDKETGEILPQEPTKKTIPLAQCSPVYQKYMRVQNNYPQAVVAYRLGDFFEIFGDNAITVSNHLDLTLTGRDCGLTERVPMVGFPYHASDTYFRKIVEFSQLVVVEDNTPTLYVLEKDKVIPMSLTDENESTMYEDNDKTDDFEEERALQKYFDKDALCILYELFDYNLDMQ